MNLVSLSSSEVSGVSTYWLLGKSIWTTNPASYSVQARQSSGHDHRVNKVPHNGAENDGRATLYPITVATTGILAIIAVLK